MPGLIYQSGNAAVLGEGFTGSVRVASAEDAGKLREMFSRVSPQTIYQRFHTPYPAVPNQLLSYMAGLAGYDGDSFVVIVGDEVVGQAMYVRDGGHGEAEIAVVVEDGWQSKGVGKILLRKLAREARRRRIEVFTGAALGENRRVLGLIRSVFDKVEIRIEDGSYQLRMPLRTLKPVAEHGVRARMLRYDVEEKLAS